jgi:phage shock protein E
MNVEKIIKEKKGTVVDVRSPAEFSGGNVLGSINIPLQEIPLKVEEIKKMKSPIILCCASGNRSGQAQRFLKEQGIDCYNGGSWMDVNYYKSQTL